MYDYLEAVKADIKKNYLKRDIVLKATNAEFIEEIQYDKRVTGCYDSYVDCEETAKQYLADNLVLVGEAFDAFESGKVHLPCYDDLTTMLANEMFHNIDINVRAYLVPKALESLCEDFDNEPPKRHMVSIYYREHGDSDVINKRIQWINLPRFLEYMEEIGAWGITINDYWEDVNEDDC